MRDKELLGLQEAYLQIYKENNGDNLLLDYLLDGGYAETPEAAEAIMVNMSEEWRQSIVEVSERGQELAHRTGQAAQKVLSRTTDPEKMAALHGLYYASSSRSLSKEYPDTPDMMVNGKPVRKVHDVRRGGTGEGEPDSDRGEDRTLTPQIRDRKRAAAGSPGKGSTPKGSKLYRQTMRGVTTGDDPMEVLRSASSGR